MSEGQCYCGALEYAITGPSIYKIQCHCRECQYISGGGPNFTMIVSAEHFNYTKGEPASFTRTDLPNPVTREFCSECGTHIGSRIGGGAMIGVKVGTLNEPAVDFEAPQAAIFLCDSQPYHVVPDTVAKFDKMPG